MNCLLAIVQTDMFDWITKHLKHWRYYTLKSECQPWVFWLLTCLHIRYVPSTQWWYIPLLSFHLDVVLRLEMWMPNTERANTPFSLYLQLKQWTWNTTSYKNQNNYRLDYISNIVSYSPCPLPSYTNCQKTVVYLF